MQSIDILRKSQYENKVGGIDISDLIPEKDKLEPEYLKQNIDYNIHNLILEKEDTIKAYRFYNGRRDPREYAYLEQNFGIGNPAKLTFTPLIRKHISVLLGMELQNPLNFKVTSTDPESVIQKNEEKKYETIKRWAELINEQIQHNLDVVKGVVKEPKDLLSEKQLRRIYRDINRSYKSTLEKNAQKVTGYFINRKKLKLKFNQLYEDLLVTGTAFYRSYIEELGKDPCFETCNPINIFFNRAENDIFFNRSTRVVYRKYMSKQEVMNRYGYCLSQDEKDMLFSLKYPFTHGYGVTSNVYMEREIMQREYYNQTTSSFDTGNYLNDVIDVYHCEWLSCNEIELEDEYDDLENSNIIQSKNSIPTRSKRKKYRLDRYEGVRIGPSIYVEMGKTKHVNRSKNEPYLCTLSYNGIYHGDRNNKPYSLILATKDLQDRYDILTFHRDNKIAQSGSKGTFVNLADIPTYLGQDETERVIKWGLLKKNGMALVDPNQEGKPFNHYGTYDDSLNGQEITAINSVLEMLEMTASSITGVSPQMLANIEQRDAVSNVQVGIKQSSLIVKKLFTLSSELDKQILTDLVNTARLCYKDGKIGSFILDGYEQELFTVNNDNFSLADYDVFISDSGEEVKNIEVIQSSINSMIEARIIDADTAISLLTKKSLTDIKDTISEKTEEANVKIVDQLQSQLKQIQDQFMKTQSELEKLKQENEKMKNQNIDFERKKHEDLVELKRIELSQKQANDSKKNELLEQQNKAEVIQLFDENKRNDEIKNIINK